MNTVVARTIFLTHAINVFQLHAQMDALTRFPQEKTPVILIYVIQSILSSPTV